jgi:hypothetical protein
MAWFDDPITNPYSGPSGHKGVDIGTPFHTAISSLVSGTIVDESYHDWGGQVVVQTQLNGHPYWAYTVHLDDIATNLKVGQQIQAGTFLGLSGGQKVGGDHPATGNWSTGPHTHFQLSDVGWNNFDNVSNPISILNAAKSQEKSSTSGITKLSDSSSNDPYNSGLNDPSLPWNNGWNIPKDIFDWIFGGITGSNSSGNTNQSTPADSAAQMVGAKNAKDFSERAGLYVIGTILFILGITVLFFSHGGGKIVSAAKGAIA